MKVNSFISAAIAAFTLTAGTAFAASTAHSIPQLGMRHVDYAAPLRRTPTVETASAVSSGHSIAQLGMRHVDYND